MIKIAKQQQENDVSCVYACLSMLSEGRWSQSEIRALMKSRTDMLSVLVQLARMGLYGRTNPTRTEILSGRLYLVTVPSLNIPGGLHVILLDHSPGAHESGVLIDPNEGREGRKYYTEETLHSWAEVVEIIDPRDDINYLFDPQRDCKTHTVD